VLLVAHALSDLMQGHVPARHDRDDRVCGIDVTDAGWVDLEPDGRPGREARRLDPRGRAK
jgi:hypothetical protein